MMAKDSALKRLAAFAAAMLLVVWIGGAAGAGLFKTAYWLLFGAWPNTALYGLMPGPVITFALTLPGDERLRPMLLFLLQVDVFTYIALIPPILLLPCLAVLLIGPGSTPPIPFQMPRFSSSGSGGPPRIDPVFRRNRGLKT